MKIHIFELSKHKSKDMQINDSFKVFSLDMLQISIELKELIVYRDGYNEKKINQKLKLIKTNRKTPNFKTISAIYYNDMNIGVIKHDPNKDVMSANSAIIYFNNEYLYKSRLNGMYKRLKYSMNFKFKQISQLDIAFDQTATEKNINWMNKFASNKIKFLGNVKKQVHYNSKDEIEYFLLGSKKSDKFMRCYYKRQEIAQSNKNYIVDFWNKNGGLFGYEKPENKEKEVFRTEISLKGSILKTLYCPDFTDNPKDAYNPFKNEKTLSIIQSAEFLSSVFIREVRNFAKYVSKKQLKKKKRTNLCRQYHIIKNMLITEPIFYLEKIRGETSKHIHKIKMASKFFYQIFKETGVNIYEDLSIDIVLMESLQKWRSSKIERWEREHSNLKITSEHFKRYLSSFSKIEYDEKYIFNQPGNIDKNGNFTIWNMKY